MAESAAGGQITWLLSKSSVLRNAWLPGAREQAEQRRGQFARNQETHPLSVAPPPQLSDTVTDTLIS